MPPVPYTETVPLEERRARAEAIRARQPGAVPIILVAENDRIKFKSEKLIVAGELRMCYVIHAVRSRVKELKPSQALYLFVNGRLFAGGSLLSEVYDRDASEDGMLYVTVAMEKTFGGVMTSVCSGDSGSDFPPFPTTVERPPQVFVRIQRPAGEQEENDQTLKDNRAFRKTRRRSVFHPPGQMGQSQAHLARKEELMSAAGLSAPPVDAKNEQEVSPPEAVSNANEDTPPGPVTTTIVIDEGLISSIQATEEDDDAVPDLIDPMTIPVEEPVIVPPPPSTPPPTEEEQEWTALPVVDHLQFLDEAERGLSASVVDFIVSVVSSKRDFFTQLPALVAESMQMMEDTALPKGASKRDIVAYAIVDAGARFGANVPLEQATGTIDVLFLVSQGQVLRLNHIKKIGSGVFGLCFGRAPKK